MYRALDSAMVIRTLETLQRRIQERFPQAGLTRVCAELVQVAKENDAKARALTRPNLVIRAFTGLVIAGGISFLAYVFSFVKIRSGDESVFGLLQGVEAGFNIALLMGAAVAFLVTLEGRWKRQRALNDLDELRSIVHVIDMHQLTKDPSSVSRREGDTESSPKRTLSPFELVRYLDYCSEMLSLAAKVAAIYAQSSRDPVVVENSSDLQQITANLSAKIWQKINIAQDEIPKP